MSILKQVAILIILAACLAPIWGTLLWELWEGSVRPRLVPRDIIQRAAAAMLVRHGDGAERMAFIAEDRAWRYSESFKQGCRQRVRKRIAAIRRQAGDTASATPPRPASAHRPRAVAGRD
ncbi:MAG: hypothetical protein QOH32_4368 [Bradyrhizobium sp.]|nr:hypothetical protein [Bradyrhizobium sp.]